MLRARNFEVSSLTPSLPRPWPYQQCTTLLPRCHSCARIDSTARPHHLPTPCQLYLYAVYEDAHTGRYRLTFETARSFISRLHFFVMAVWLYLAP